MLQATAPPVHVDEAWERYIRRHGARLRGLVYLEAPPITHVVTKDALTAAAAVVVVVVITAVVISDTTRQSHEA